MQNRFAEVWFVYLFFYFLKEGSWEKKRIKCEYKPISLWTLIDWCTWCGLFCVIVRLFVGHIVVVRDNLLKHLNFQHVSGSFPSLRCIYSNHFQFYFYQFISSSTKFTAACVYLFSLIFWKCECAQFNLHFASFWKLHFFDRFFFSLFFR